MGEGMLLGGGNEREQDMEGVRERGGVRDIVREGVRE